ncbi:MAG: glycosyltransferase family 9 protein [Candidatus Melainabacteria bacterium]|nr:MAG: glycosyltransferase family 9 protein [Candidatus Melainabacteria bacterium]
MKFLIVKLSAIGDVIHALPVASYLKRAVPGCTVTWLVEKASAGLVSNNPAIDEVVIFSGKKWVKELGKPGAWLRNFSEARQFFAELRAAKYDAVLELQGLLKSSLLARASGARVVAGFDDTREFADRFLTHKLNVGDYFGHDVPVVELNLRVAHYALTVLGLPAPELPVEFSLPLLDSSVDVKVDALLISASSTAPGVEPGGAGTKSGTVSVAVPQNSAPDLASIPSVAATPDMEASASRFTNKVGPINIILIPGTTWVTKIWPNSKWIELGEKLADQYPCRLVLVGGPAEVQSNYAIAAGIEAKRPEQMVLNLTGQTSLLDLISVFRRSALVIGADTGPLHLAAATGYPKVVGVFGSTPAKRNGPYGKQCKTVHLSLECQPCYSKTCKYGTVACLTDLDSSKVFEAALDM